MDIVLSSLGQLLDLTNILMLVLGVFIGVGVGGVPGLTATMAVALALPLTFGMEPITGLLLLIGIYKGGLYAGSITAILINTPGTPAAACTVLDGYPLARLGKGRKALQMALYASCIADFISNLALILLAAQLAKLAGSFGPPEYFWLIVFSLTVVMSVSGASLMRGLVSTAIGLLLATVGLDLVHGTPRFVFGFFELYDGISLVPALIGLFAIPEVISFYSARQGAAMVYPSGGEGLRWQEFRSSLRSIVKGSFIGVIVGALPGTGATPAAFISYAEARRSSKNRRNFGKGELEGVAAAEAANNGTAGATLIPLLALGIPGDVVTAIMLGAFMIHGLTPGPLLFQENIGFIYALFAGIMVSSAVLLVVGRIAIATFSRVTDVPSHILVPLILMFCIYGSFAVNNSFFDVGIMIAMGLVGYTLVRFDFPLPPLLIGMVLGRLLEDNFRRSMLLGRGDPAYLFESWLSFLFIALAIISIAINLYQHRSDQLQLQRGA